MMKRHKLKDGQMLQTSCGEWVKHDSARDAIDAAVKKERSRAIAMCETIAQMCDYLTDGASKEIALRAARSCASLIAGGK